MIKIPPTKVIRHTQRTTQLGAVCVCVCVCVCVVGGGGWEWSYCGLYAKTTLPHIHHQNLPRQTDDIPRRETIHQLSGWGGLASSQLRIPTKNTLTNTRIFLRVHVYFTVQFYAALSPDIGVFHVCTKADFSLAPGILTRDKGVSGLERRVLIKGISEEWQV